MTPESTISRRGFCEWRTAGSPASSMGARYEKDLISTLLPRTCGWNLGGLLVRQNAARATAGISAGHEPISERHLCQRNFGERPAQWREHQHLSGGPRNGEKNPGSRRTTGQKGNTAPVTGRFHSKSNRGAAEIAGGGCFYFA